MNSDDIAEPEIDVCDDDDDLKSSQSSLSLLDAKLNKPLFFSNSLDIKPKNLLFGNENLFLRASSTSNNLDHHQSVISRETSDHNRLSLGSDHPHHHKSPMTSDDERSPNVSSSLSPASPEVDRRAMMTSSTDRRHAFSIAELMRK